MKNTLLLFLTLITGFSLQAQSTLIGKLVDAQDKTSLPGAHVYLSGTQERSEITDVNGLFRFNDLPKGTYQLLITYLGYDSLKVSVDLGAKDNKWLGELAMSSGSTILKEVEITGKQARAIQKGDTTAFNADAYKTNRDASAEDLVRKLPGISVDGSGVQAQGEQVQEVLVNGQRFFGNDPTAALRNLPAEIVSQVEVFDQLSEQDRLSGYQGGETTKALNIKLRPGMANGTFGKVYGGYGYDNVYKAGGNLNFFNEDQRITILGQSNNINQQNFSSEDLAGVSSGGGRRSWRRRGAADNFLVGQQPGISTTHSLGLNFSDKWGEKVTVNGSYFFNNSNNSADRSLRQTFFTDEDVSTIYEEVRESERINFNHRFNGRLEYKINDRNTIVFRPRFSAQINDGTERTLGATLAGPDTINATRNENITDVTALNFQSELTYNHNFEKRGRSFSISLENGYNQSRGEGFQLSELRSINRPSRADTLDQRSDLNTDGWSLEADLRYNEPLGKRGQLRFSYELEHEFDDSDRATFDFSEGSQDYDQIVGGLSNVFNSTYTTHEGQLGYRWRGEKFFISARLSGEWAFLDGLQEFPVQGAISRNWFNVLPSAYARLEISDSDNMRFGYRSRTRAPSISQLQNVVDNSNPLQLRTGNPELDQSVSHRLFMRYNRTNPEKANVFYLLLRGEVTDNYIASNTIFSKADTVINGVIIPAGGQLTLPVNLDGYWNVRSFLTYGFPVGFLSSNLNVNLGVTYTRQPGQIDFQINYANSTNLEVGLSLTSNISEKLDFNIGTTSGIGFVRNTLQSQLDNRFLNQQSNLGLVWTFGPEIVFRTSANHQLFLGLSEGFDQNFLLWNASIGKRLFKNQQGEINLQVFDILGQNASVSRNITETYIEDVNTQVLQRYVMLTFSYNIRNFRSIRKAGIEEQQRRRRW